MLTMLVQGRCVSTLTTDSMELLAYNDANFKHEDWKGLQSFKQSVKKDDPFKIGKFGIGFNSVYHITGEQTLNN